MISAIEDINNFIYNIVSGPYMLIFLVGAGIYITFRLKFFQLFKVGFIFKNTIGTIFKNKDNISNDSISPFQAMTTSLAGTMGIGNIVGIGTAIVYGGVGSIFWMWVSAFFGCATKYAEIFLAVKYRSKNKSGQYVGGPMYYLEKGLNNKWLAILFCVFCAFASFGIGNMTQINSVSSSLNINFNIDKSFSGIVFLVIVGMVILGGIKRIGKITEKVIPFMSILYILGALFVILMNYENIPYAFSLIFKDAFKIDAVISGAFGYMLMNAIRYGFSRGIFSNEAGLGSSPIVHAASKSDDIVKQSCWGVFEVLIDTIVVCTITTLAIITSGVFKESMDGSQFTEYAFRSVMGNFGSSFISISIVFFAISSMLSWAYYGERSIEYISDNKKLIFIYRMCFLACIYIGAVTEIDLVWRISDTLNCLMAIPNIIGVLSLSSVVYNITNKRLRIKNEDME